MAFSTSIQALGRDISRSAFAFTFSALSGKVLILVGLIAGAGSLTGSRAKLLPYTNFYVEVLTQFWIKLLHVEVLTKVWIKRLH